MEEPLAQVSSASLQQKWKYGSYKVSIASERLLENECQCLKGFKLVTITCDNRDFMKDES